MSEAQKSPPLLSPPLTPVLHKGPPVCVVSTCVCIGQWWVLLGLLTDDAIAYDHESASPPLAITQQLLLLSRIRP